MSSPLSNSKASSSSIESSSLESNRNSNIASIDSSKVIRLIRTKRPFTRDYFRSYIHASKEEVLLQTYIKYLVDLKIVVYSKYKTILNPIDKKILEHLKVRIPIPDILYIYSTYTNTSIESA